MKAYKIVLSLLLPAIASGLLESTLNEEDIVPDDVSPQSSGLERHLAHHALPGLTSIMIPSPSTSKGKGKGKGGSKGSKGATEPQCDVYRVFYEKEEYRKLLTEISTGKGSKGSTIGFSVDRLTLYDAVTTVRVGFVTETNLITGNFDCTATGALSFAETASGRSKNQMFYQGEYVHVVVPTHDTLIYGDNLHRSSLPIRRYMLDTSGECNYRRKWSLRMRVRHSPSHPTHKSKDLPAAFCLLSVQLKATLCVLTNAYSILDEAASSASSNDLL